MLSAVISSERSYSTVPLAGQPIHQRFVRSGLLILGAAPLNLQRLQQIRTELSRACDSIISNGTDYIFILASSQDEDSSRLKRRHIFIVAVAY